jgi:transposase, IS30 family
LHKTRPKGCHDERRDITGTNGLLRQYFPKATDLNGRPRKTLGWDTPAERLRDLLTT